MKYCPKCRKKLLLDERWEVDLYCPRCGWHEDDYEELTEKQILEISKARESRRRQLLDVDHRYKEHFIDVALSEISRLNRMIGRYITLYHPDKKGDYFG